MSRFIYEAGIDFRRLLEAEEGIYFIKEIRSKTRMSLRYSHVRIAQGHFGEKSERRDFTANADSLNGEFEKDEISYPFRFIRADNSSNLFAYFVLGRFSNFLRQDKSEIPGMREILEYGKKNLDELSGKWTETKAIILRRADVSRLGIDQERGLLAIQ